MGDNKAIALEERILREEKARRLYLVGRFGSNAVLDDPYWSPFDNAKVAPLHDHRTPYALLQENFGLKEFRDARAAGNEAREKTPALALEPAPAEPLREQRAVPPAPSPARMPSGQQRSDTAGSRGNILIDADVQMPKSASAASLPSRMPSCYSASRAGSIAASRRSLRSHASMASLRSQIGEAVQREVARSELKALMLAKEAKLQRKRQAQLDMPPHLRTGANPIYMGCPQSYLTEQMRTLQLPIKMATDPKWSVEIKRINNRIGQRLEWERKMAASLSGSIIPELKHMPPKDYVSNPPTPYFVPGQAEKSRTR